MADNANLYGQLPFGQLPSERRGEADARNASVKTRLDTAEAELALIDSGAWTAYTPAWTASGGATGLGAATLLGYYTKLGRSVRVQIQFTYGAGMSLPSGTYYLSLPFAAVTGRWQPLSAWYYDTGSPGAMFAGIGSPFFGGATASQVAVHFHGNAQAWGLNWPVPPAVNDFIEVFGAYEAA